MVVDSLAFRNRNYKKFKNKNLTIMVPAIPLPRLADQVPHGAEGTTEASSQPFKSIISSYIRQRKRETIIFSKH